MNAVETILEGRTASLFAGCADADCAKKTYKTLAKSVHPDRCPHPRAAEAFSALTKFFEVFSENPESTAVSESTVLVTRNDGIRAVVHYVRKHQSDLTTDYVTHNGVLRVFATEKDAKHAEKIVNSVRGVVESSAVLKSYARIVPSDSYSMRDSKTVYFRRDPKTASLRDVLDAWGPWDPRHAAWLASCLMDFACFANYQGFAHCALTPTNIFVDTENHAVQVIGGWEFAEKRNTKITRLPRFVYDACSPEIRGAKRATAAIDVSAAKHVVRTAMEGWNDRIPPAFAAWLASGTVGVDPTAEYERWERARSAAFPKKFVVFGKQAGDVYKEK